MLTFNFKLNEQETQVILTALSREPYITVVEVISNLQQQAQKQIKEKELDSQADKAKCV